MVLVAAGVSGYDFQPGNDEKAQNEIALFNHMEELWVKKAFDELADLEVHAWADGPSQSVGRAPTKIRDDMRKIIMANYTRQDGQATPIPLAPLAASRLSEIHVPTLVLIGEYDEIATLKAAEKLEKEIPGARKLVFPSTAHMIPLEQPALFNKVVLNFLNKEV